MVKILESTKLKYLSLSDLKKHAKNLRRDGYQISGYSSFLDTPEDLSKLRKMIRKAQKDGKTGSSLVKSSKCNPGFENITQCQKKTTVKRVRELAEECGIETDKVDKPTLCKNLMNAQNSSKKSPKKSPSTDIKETDDYKKLDKMKKKDSKENDLIDFAHKLKISYGEQDGESIPITKLRKHELILTILKKQGKEYPKKDKKDKSPKKDKKDKKDKKKNNTNDLDEFESDDKKIIATTGTIKSLKKALTHDDWSAEELARQKLINDVAVLTGRSKRFYQDWSIKNLGERLEAANEERSVLLDNSFLRSIGRPKSFYKDWNNEDLRHKIEGVKQQEYQERNNMIKQIVAITGENPEDYKSYNFDQVMDILDEVKQKDKPKTPKESSSDSDDSSDEEKPVTKKPLSKTPEEDSSESDDDKPLVTKKDKSPTPEDSSSESDDSSDDEQPVSKKDKPPTPEESSSDSDDSDRPDEGVEVVDVESTLANVIAGGKNIGDLAKVQQTILKCMGLLA